MSFWAFAAGALSFIGQRRTNRQVEQMAANRHQVEVEDLRAAGLNPILSATGSGAPMPNIQNPWSPAVQAGSQVYSAQSTAEMQSTQSELNRLKGEIMAPLADVASIARRLTASLGRVLGRYNDSDLDGAISAGLDTAIATIKKAVKEGGEVATQVATEFQKLIDEVRRTGKEIDYQLNIEYPRKWEHFKREVHKVLKSPFEYDEHHYDQQDWEGVAP